MLEQELLHLLAVVADQDEEGAAKNGEVRGTFEDGVPCLLFEQVHRLALLEELGQSLILLCSADAF